MRAAIYRRFGKDVVEVGELPDPIARRGEVVVRVRASALNPKDVMTSRGKLALFSGRRFPMQLGYDWAGEVIAIGPGVSGVTIGERRFGMIQSWRAGAIAERAAVRVEESARLPDAIEWAWGAAIALVSLTALQALRDEGGLRAGGRVLIHGASGGVGVHAIQIAKLLGAHVTTTSSAGNRELCRSLGADETLDYATDDLAARGERWDVFFDVFGNRRFAFAKPLLTTRGRYVQTVPAMTTILDVARTSLSRGAKAKLVVVRSNATDLGQIAAWMTAGSLRAVIDGEHSLDDVRVALERQASKRARGKIVIRP